MANVNLQNPDYVYMIEQAVKAPSGHNTQPWLFRVNEDQMEILPNEDKSLPVVDPHNRELFISLGCAAENLCIAASQKGYAADLHVSEAGIITVRLRRESNVSPDDLFPQIAVRQTNRSVYNGQTIPDNTVGSLKEIVETSAVNARFYKRGTQEFNTISDYIMRGNVQQMQDNAFVDELKSWMRFNKKHQDETNDGLSYAVFGAPNLPRFIVKPIMSGYLNSKTQNQGDKKKIASSSHFVLLTTAVDTPEEWIQLGRMMERLLLKSTELGIIHAYMNQPNEISQLSVEMAEALNLPDESPAILLRMGYGEKVPYSKRKNIREVILNE